VFLGVPLIPVVLAATILLIQPSLDLAPFRGTIAQSLSSAMGRELRQTASKVGISAPQYP
jgi:hypothetical protein